MGEIILDFGSGNSCGNDCGYIKRMIDALAEIDKERKCVIKWQLAKHNPPNVPLLRSSFTFAWEYGTTLGFKVTASVFDVQSLSFLLRFNIPFVKIPCIPSLYFLAGEVPRNIPVYISAKRYDMKYVGRQWTDNEIYIFECIRKYPAKLEEYEGNEYDYYSDHTKGWGLWYKFSPEKIEKHYIIERDKDNPDAGPFAIEPDDLREIL